MIAVSFDYFYVCQRIAEALTSVPGLRSVTAEQASAMRIAPAGATAVVAFGGETVGEHIGDAAYSAEQTYSVALMCRGATRAGEEDGLLVHAVIRALHGLAPLDGERGFLRYTGLISDYEDNARYYTLSFNIGRIQELTKVS